MKKVRNMIRMNKEVVKIAKKHRVSISSFLDIELRRYLAIIEGKSNSVQSSKNKEWTCRDLNPRPPPCQGVRL
ncbi:MAG: hypothetical protein AYK22_05085 [Thermoplasmatales archaeon SG8-52-3]|nr:MAG: hypothetical protein AYK22_05085 [Thermoplasmatales archaeon SG8-52-3]